MLKPRYFLTFCFLKRSLNLNNEALTGKHLALPSPFVLKLFLSPRRPTLAVGEGERLRNTSLITWGVDAPLFMHPQRDPSSSYS